MTDDASGYRPLFVPDAAAQPFEEVRAFRFGDATRTGTTRYVFDRATALAVNVAMATGRPLLLRGHPGTGKTSLAQSVADQMGWRFYAITVSSRTTARDLLWTFDTVERLADAEARRLRHERAYVTPGPLWWAFNRESAGWRGVPVEQRVEAARQKLVEEADPSPVASDRAVVLVDEIDKADPDVPNDLLLPLGSLRFRYDETTTVTAVKPPFVVVTTNEERDLPRAFLRRCIVHTLEQPDPARLRQIAQVHAGADWDDGLYDLVLRSYDEIRDRRIEARLPPPSVAELLDALAACRSLGAGTASPDWPFIARNVLDKATSIPPEQPSAAAEDTGPNEA
jgi:MoxR-like ATPase